jgi:hypothetical protein
MGDRTIITAEQLAETAEMFGSLMIPAEPVGDDVYEMIYAGRESAERFALWALSKGLTVSTPDAWTVRVHGI